MKVVDSVFRKEKTGDLIDLEKFREINLDKSA